MVYELHFGNESLIITTGDEGNGNIVSTLDHGRKGSRWDAAIDVLESFALAAVCAGIKPDHRLREAIQTTYEAIANNLGD